MQLRTFSLAFERRRQRGQVQCLKLVVIIVGPSFPLLNPICIQNDAIIAERKVNILVKSNLVGPQQPSHFPKQDGCPSIKYSQPSCQPGLLHHPDANAIETELFQDMFNGFSCLATAIVMPWMNTGSACTDIDNVYRSKKVPLSYSVLLPFPFP